MKKILVFVLTVTLLVSSLMTGSVLSHAQAGFSKTYSNPMSLSVTVNTRQGPLYSIDLNKFVTNSFYGNNAATAELGTAENGQVFVRLDGTDGDCFVTPVHPVEADTDNLILPHYVYIKYRTPTPSSMITAQLFASSQSSLAGTDAVTFYYNNDNQWHLLRVGLSSSTNYNYDNFLNYLRFDFFDNGNLGSYVDIQMISWFRNDADAEHYNRTVYGEDLKVETANSAVADISYPLGVWGTRVSSATPSTGYRFGACIDTINYASFGSDQQSYKNGDTGVLHVATKDGFTAGTLENGRKVIILSGWALVNGGQNTDGSPCFYWSLDQSTWHAITDVSLADAEPVVVTAATTLGALTSAVAANGRFGSAVIDLTGYEGQTLSTVYFAMATGNTPVVILKLTNVKVPS